MRTAFLCCLVLAMPALAQDKKPEPITPENIEVGKVGTIEKLVVEKAFPELNNIIAEFRGIRVLVRDFPAAGVGKGKILPKDQVWRVDSVIEKDSSGNNLSGCYLIKPVKKDEKKK